MVFMVLNTLKHRKKVKYVDTKCKDRLCTVADNPGLVPHHKLRSSVHQDINNNIINCRTFIFIEETKQVINAFEMSS